MVFDYVTDWHIEPTNRCTLACSKCPRTLMGVNKISDLDVQSLKNFLTPEVLETCRYVSMAGNFGDPIYHPNLPEMVNYFDSPNLVVNITTNGSHRNKKWWDNLLCHMKEKDQITFSVDGLEDTNHIYRINSKWSSILDAMKLVTQSHVRARWKFIVFKHNQHQIDQAQQLAKDLGFEKFQTVYSNRYNGMDDSLRPDEQYVSKAEPSEELPYVNAFCQTRVGHFINAHGNYYPCCWIEFKEPFILPISDHTLQEIFNHEEIKKLAEGWKNSKTCNSVCREKCAYKLLNDQKSVLKKLTKRG